MTRPVLHTPRIRLEPLTRAHTELLVELDSDPEVLHFIWGRALGWWVGLGTDDEFLGWWCLALDDEDPTGAELGYRLRRAAWGHGYASEGSRGLLRHAFDTVGLARVWAEANPANTASRGVLEKVGLSRTVSTGALVRYELTRENWSA